MCRILSRGLTALVGLLAFTGTLPASAQQEYQFKSFYTTIAPELEPSLPLAILSPTCLSDNGVIGFQMVMFPSFQQYSLLVDGSEWEVFTPRGILGINASGATVGGIGAAAWVADVDNVATTFQVPGSSSSTARSISANGTIAGSFVSGGVTRGFIRDTEENFTTVQYPGSVVTQLRGINASGTATGIYTVTVPNPNPGPPTVTRTKAFVYDRQGNYATLDIPGAINANANGINNRGEIVGGYSTTNAILPPPLTSRTFGFIYDGGNVKTIDAEPGLRNPINITFLPENVVHTYYLVPNTCNTNVVAINTRGDIVATTSARYTSPTRPDVLSITDILVGSRNRSN